MKILIMAQGDGRCHQPQTKAASDRRFNHYCYSLRQWGMATIRNSVGLPLHFLPLFHNRPRLTGKGRGQTSAEKTVARLRLTHAAANDARHRCYTSGCIHTCGAFRQAAKTG